MATAALPTLLLVHGAWHGAWCWEDRFVPWLEGRGYTVVAPNLRKHGLGVDRAGLRWTRIADYVADVEHAVAAVPEPVILVGHSMGGLVVQKVLERHRPAGAVLLASVPVGGVLGATLRVLRRHPLNFAKANLTMRLWPLVETPEIARDLLFSPETPEADVRRHHARLQDEAYLAYLDMIAVTLPRAERVRSPVLVMGAEQDGVFTPAEVRRTARAYGTEAVLFARGGHDMMLDLAWEDVAKRMDGWIRERLLPVV